MEMSLITKMSNDLLLDSQTIKRIAFNSEKFYRVYEVDKKNGSGEKRLIYHPSPQLKALQYWVVHNILSAFPVSGFSMAYEQGCSIKKNAFIHKDAKHLLHMDISSFFESITKDYIEETILCDSDLDDDDKELFYKITLFKNHLVIGSVSSPSISNRVMYGFDLKLHGIASQYGNLRYTRYADDLVFSGPDYIDSNIVTEVEDELRKRGFKLNHRKTSFMSSATRKSVTGLVVDDGNVTVGYRRKRQIKSMVYNKLEHGIGDANIILGYLFFLKGVEPGYFDKIIAKYSDYGNVLELLKAESKKEPGEKGLKEVATTVLDFEECDK